MNDFENKLAGVCMALLCGMDSEAKGRVIEALESFAEDRNTPLSESMFYRDLAESIEPTPQPVWFVFERLETLH